MTQSIREIISAGNGRVHFKCYSKGELWYITDGGFEFPVPTEDAGDGIFLAQDKALLFMRYIRKHLDYLNQARHEALTNVATS